MQYGINEVAHDFQMPIVPCNQHGIKRVTTKANYSIIHYHISNINFRKQTSMHLPQPHCWSLVKRFITIPIKNANAMRDSFRVYRPALLRFKAGFRLPGALVNLKRNHIKRNSHYLHRQSRVLDFLS